MTGGPIRQSPVQRLLAPTRSNIAAWHDLLRLPSRVIPHLGCSNPLKSIQICRFSLWNRFSAQSRLRMHVDLATDRLIGLPFPYTPYGSVNPRMSSGRLGDSGSTISRRRLRLRGTGRSQVQGCLAAVDPTGFEPVASWLQTRRSSN